MAVSKFTKYLKESCILSSGHLYFFKCFPKDDFVRCQDIIKTIMSFSYGTCIICYNNKLMRAAINVWKNPPRVARKKVTIIKGV